MRKSDIEDLIAASSGVSGSISQLSPPTEAFSFDNQRLTNLGEPLFGKDAANKEWVLSQIQSGGVATNRFAFRFRVLLGDVPFTSGTAGTI